VRWLLLAVVTIVAFVALSVLGLGKGWLGRHEGPGTVGDRAIPAPLVAARAVAQAEGAAALGAPADKRILFGDLHVHTTISGDAFLISLPVLGGEGAHPQADACDFARYCSALDFWSINDHAEFLDERRWRETVESIRQCNAVAGDAQDPDVVAFLGWEWTQKGTRPENHFGHRNVVLRHTDDDRIPARPIGSRSVVGSSGVGVWLRAGMSLLARDRRTADYARFVEELRGVPVCPDDVAVRELSLDCMESTGSPGELFAKLDDWGHEALVIPHGTAWGWTAPPGSSYASQLNAAQHDPDRQTLVEVYSGHGNSEEYRSFRDVEPDGNGGWRCAEASADYNPGCRRAGEIIAERCLAVGEAPTECEARAEEARRLYVEAGRAGFLTVPGASVEDWLDAGQCRDCFLPAFDYRPLMSVQAMLAMRHPTEPAGARRFRFGFLGSSDNHTARPGTGYKEVNRREMTEAVGFRTDVPDRLRRLAERAPEEPRPRAVPYEPRPGIAFAGLDRERAASFFTTGGLVAVHAAGRSRDAIWDALERREVYGTSGGRTLLWFDLVDGPGGRRIPMGGELRTVEAPEFEVSALGAFEQRPGCPDYAVSSLSPERIDHLCRGECFHPGERRKRITRIEVVRIRPQTGPLEPIGGRIEDPWRVLPCDDAGAGCRVRFADPEFAGMGRDTLYYVRAIEAPSPAVNGASLRCERDGAGRCVELEPCHGAEDRTAYQDDCLATVEERAWSSPIFLDFGS
jgi:hypothetical protein